MIIRKVNIARATLDACRFPRSPWPEIAIVGRSNVGKSSLLNTLLGRRKLAGTSKDPGKTRSVNFYAVNDRLYLVDLPGYGFARVSEALRARWRETIERYILERENLAGVVQLVDSRRPPTASDTAMMELVRSAGRKSCIVLTKADKITRSERSSALSCARRSNSEAEIFFFSARTGEGREELWKWIEERLGK